MPGFGLELAFQKPFSRLGLTFAFHAHPHEAGGNETSLRG
jgi:hypothetical protein